MRGLILAGGKGTRLRPLTVYTPKPIVPIVNRPLLLYQIDILKRAGVNHITLSLSYQPDKIEQVLGDGSEFGVELHFVTEPSPMGTAGAYKYAAGPERETTVVLNGDILTDADLGAVFKTHREKGAAATVVLTPVEKPGAFGLVEVGENAEVFRFLEKPGDSDKSSPKVNNVNAGIYILEPIVLDLIPENENRSFEYNVFPELIAKKIPFYGYDLGDAYWRDVGTPSSYLQANLDLLNGGLKGFEIEREELLEQSPTAFIDKHSVIAGDCIIKPNSRIVNSVLGPGVHVEERSVIENSVIWAHSRISGNSEIQHSLLGKGCYVGRNVHVGGGSVLGDKASLPDYSRV